MPAYIIKQPNGLYCRYSTIVDDITDCNMTKDDYINLATEHARENIEWDWEHNKFNKMSFDELKQKLIDFCPITDEEWKRYNGGEYTEDEVRLNKERREEIYDTLDFMCKPIEVKSGIEPKIGDFLYGIPSNEESAKYNPEDERVFIYNGRKSGDGWGKLIGFENHKIVKSTEWNNFMWGGDIRKATDVEIDNFMKKIMYQEKIIDR